VKSANELQERHLGCMSMCGGKLSIGAYGLPSLPRIIPFGNFLGGTAATVGAVLVCVSRVSSAIDDM
jgi:hypothetical protein